MSAISLGSGTVSIHCDNQLPDVSKPMTNCPQPEVRNLKTNCPNCGAPVDLHAEKCAYCDTPYITQLSESITLKLDTAQIVNALEAGIITPNEARRRLGLPPIP